MNEKSVLSRAATLSDCGKYRYELERGLGAGKTCGVVMVNPSTADATKDDATIRKLIGFAQRNGWGKILVCNKFAYRATDVGELRCGVKDPVGPDNDEAIQDVMIVADVILVAWGPLSKLPEALRDRWKQIVRMSDKIRPGHPLMCLGTAKDGHPRHPLMVPYAQAPVEWHPPWFAGRAIKYSHPASDVLSQ